MCLSKEPYDHYTAVNHEEHVSVSVMLAQVN